jgi:glycosyltransferase involved in cell wall biosynthesis
MPELAFSIIIPTRDRPDCVACCLQAVAALHPPPGGFEVIVVDDGSLVPLDGIAAPFQQSLSLTVIRQPGAGPGAARNAGARQARGRWLAFTDDDCVPHPDWLAQLLPVLHSNPTALVGGRTVNGLTGNRYSRASQQLISYLYDYYQARHGQPRFLASCNLAVASEGFTKSGGFDTRYMRASAEDRDLSDRWHATGLPLIYHPGAVVTHRHQLDLRSFLRQHFNYGCGAWHFRLARAARHGGRVRIEPAHFYAGLLAYPFRIRDSMYPLSDSVLLALSQAANFAGFLAARLRLDRPSSGH